MDKFWEVGQAENLSNPVCQSTNNDKGIYLVILALFFKIMWKYDWREFLFRTAKKKKEN